MKKSFMRKAMLWVVVILIGAVFGPVGLAIVVVVGTSIRRASAIARSSQNAASSTGSDRKEPEGVSCSV
jgi:hypothetical protein